MAADPKIATLEIVQFLTWLPGVSSVRAKTLVREVCSVKPGDRVGSLSREQRLAIALAIIGLFRRRDRQRRSVVGGESPTVVVH